MRITYSAPKNIKIAIMLYFASRYGVFNKMFIRENWQLTNCFVHTLPFDPFRSLFRSLYVGHIIIILFIFPFIRIYLFFEHIFVCGTTLSTGWETDCIHPSIRCRCCFVISLNFVLYPKNTSHKSSSTTQNNVCTIYRSIVVVAVVQQHGMWSTRSL